ncbi:MAG: right-handed parallel beta-helix repeat-containing protein [Bacteroidetes bacterium]|nr:right-handed parallel beta-helix repeat-containing protein [Bacteroidota bacterium]
MTKNYINQNVSVFDRWLKSAFLVIAMFALAASVNAQTINTTAVAGFSNNNGSGTVTFNFQNTNPYAVIITDIEGIVGTAGLTSADIWYKTTPVNGPPGAMSVANGARCDWYLYWVANTTTLVTQPMLSGISVTIPAGVTYGMAVSAYSLTAGRQRYHTMVTPNIPLTTVSAGGCNILMGTLISYATGAPPTAPTITPRGWLGKLTFVPAVVCSSPSTPGSATAIPSSGLCVGSNIALALSGASGGTGQTYQWQSSSAIGGPYTNLGSSSSAPTLNTPATATLYYRCEVTCSFNSQLSTPVLVTVNSPFPSGTYTINSAVSTGGTNYQTFAAAVSAISCGIAGPVVFNVVGGSGPYNEQIDIPAIGGTSAVNTITFNGNNCTLTSAGGASYATLNMNGADYVTFNNLIINATNATLAFGIHMMNASNNNTFNNCTVTVSATATVTTSAAVSMSGSTTSYSTAGTNGSNNLFTGCTVSGGYFGFVFYGDGSSYTTNSNNNIVNCTILDSYLYGIYHYYQGNASISGNLIWRPTRTVFGSTYGIFLTTGCVNVTVEKNRIRNMFFASPGTTGLFYGIYCSSTSASTGLENKFFNNVISDINSASGTQAGLYLTSATYINAYHNTISFADPTSTGGTTYGVYATGGTAVDVRNNVISITRAGTGTRYGVYYSRSSWGDK